MENQEKNYSIVNLGPILETNQYRFKHPKLASSFPGKKFLQSDLGLTGMEVSINALPPGVSMPFKHRHKKNEEFYYFLKGEGEFFIDGIWHEVKEGTAIRVAPEGVRSWRNKSSDPLFYIVIQATANSMSGGVVSDGVVVKD